MDLQLHPKQGEAFLTKATELLYGGAAGGGKSHLMRVAAIAWCFAIPGLQVYIFRRTSPDLYKNHMEGPTAFPAMLATWVRKRFVRIIRNEIRFWNGSTIFLCHCQYEKDVVSYKGAEIHVLMMDELTTFTEYIYRYLRGRVRLGGLKLPAEWRGLFPRIVNGSNPGDIGHNWVKATFIDPAPYGEIWRPSKGGGGMVRQYIPALLDDNPTLTENDPDYADRLEGLGSPDLVRAMLRGDWDIVSGGMFDDVWRRDVHVIEPFEIPESWYRDRTFDWGSSKPYSVGFWAESDGTTAPNGRTYPRGSLFRFDEIYGCTPERPNVGLKRLAVEVAREVLEREAQYPYGINPGPADSSIYDVDNGPSIGDDMEDEGVYWTRADKSPGSRKTGWERMRRYLKAALADHLEDPCLYVFNTCVDFIRTVPVLPRDPRHTDDVDTKAEDHIADESRYRLLDQHPVPTTPVAGGRRAQFEPAESGW